MLNNVCHLEPSIELSDLNIYHIIFKIFVYFQAWNSWYQRPYLQPNISWTWRLSPTLLRSRISDQGPWSRRKVSLPFCLVLPCTLRHMSIQERSSCLQLMFVLFFLSYIACPFLISRSRSLQIADGPLLSISMKRKRYYPSVYLHLCRRLLKEHVANINPKSNHAFFNTVGKVPNLNVPFSLAYSTSCHKLVKLSMLNVYLKTDKYSAILHSFKYFFLDEHQEHMSKARTKIITC